MHFSRKKLNFVCTDDIISYLYIRDTVISQEEAEQLMCPPSPNGDLDAKNEHPPRLQRLNSIHVGPVQLPHPVRMPNGRVRNNSKIRSCSEDNSSKHIRYGSHKMSPITIFDHKHFRQNFDIFYEKFLTASNFGSYLLSNFRFSSKITSKMRDKFRRKWQLWPKKEPFFPRLWGYFSRLTIYIKIFL